MTALVPGCGNEILESGEECDGSNLSGASCTTKGFTGGTLTCTQSCLYNTTACTNSSSGGGGGSSSGGNNSAQVVIAGRAYPHSKVTILKDAQVVATTISDDAAQFQVIVQNLAAGIYIFSLYSEDTAGVRSAVRTFPVTVTKGVLAKIESIYISPTIVGDKIVVKQGDPIVLFGQSTPQSSITLEVHSAQPFFVKTNTGTDGAYLYNFNSALLDIGEHQAQARSSIDSIITPQSSAYMFAVGTENIYGTTTVRCPKRGDLNKDCRVNLVDFSIAAYWYSRPLSPAFILREKESLSGDGKVNLVDLSIMAFYWTG